VVFVRNRQDFSTHSVKSYLLADVRI